LPSGEWLGRSRDGYGGGVLLGIRTAENIVPGYVYNLVNNSQFGGSVKYRGRPELGGGI